MGSKDFSMVIIAWAKDVFSILEIKLRWPIYFFFKKRDLRKLQLFSVFQNKTANVSYEDVELASDGNILDMCYCEKYNYFAYASTDKMCYIRKFSKSGMDMTLVNTLQGHLNDVNCIRWNPITENWISGSEDCTLRIWVSIGCCWCWTWAYLVKYFSFAT